MKKQTTDDFDKEWFEQHMGPALSRFDAVHAPPMPELHEFERLVREQAREAKRRLWKELAFFWLATVFVLGSMLWLFDSSRIGFAAVQAVLAAGGIGFVGLTFGRRTGYKWKS